MSKIHGFVAVSGAESREHQETLLAKRTTSVGSDLQFRAEYDANDNPIYMGLGAKGLASSVDGWLITKFTYVGGNLTLRQSVIGIWDDRDTLSYT